MCGFAGFLTREGSIDSNRTDQLGRSMADAIAHRGPDAQGVWCDTNSGVVLSHARLAIIDLSPAGAQPMLSPGGRLVIAFNGEIYNHLELREQLAQDGLAPDWRGHSDTETLIVAMERWGIRKTLDKAVGMFALALWDREDRSLTLARDRLGEKPLYYGWQAKEGRRAFLFGSELKALRQHPAFDGEIDRNALSDFFRYGYVPAPLSIHRNIRKLEPGTFATLHWGRDELVHSTYWDPEQVIATGQRDPFAGSPDEAVDRLEELLSEAVRGQMMADVPLGAFLSGGIDSSTICALMQAQSSRPVRTFSIGFREEGYDEAQHARAVAAHLGTEHTELYVTAEEARGVIPSLPQMYDEPFADASQIPTHLVARMARRDVAVSLSGDAGDELFCGYDRYGLTGALWGRIRKVPVPLRRMGSRLATGIPPSGWNAIALAVGRAVPAIARLPNPGYKIHKAARVIASRDTSALYRGMVSHWDNPDRLVRNGRERSLQQFAGDAFQGGLSDVEAMMAVDLVTYLPDDILVKVDRAAMAVSLETRVPMLDHRVVEFAWSLPLEIKLRDGKTKWPLRQLVQRHVPRELIERPKMGFGMPIGAWLRGSLRDWAEELLDARRLEEEGFLDPMMVRKMWELHLSGAASVEYHLWDVLMFQAWLADFRGSGEGARREAPLLVQEKLNYDR